MEEIMINIENDIKRWTILDKLTNRIFDVNDEQFQHGIENKYIKLRGQFIQVENKHKIWIDGITDR
jgi:hypothetical protein